MLGWFFIFVLLEFNQDKVVKPLRHGWLLGLKELHNGSIIEEINIVFKLLKTEIG